MYTLQKYDEYIRTLTNSLTIKLVDVGIAINKGLLYYYNINDGSDKHNWKYFLNIAGLPHHTNNQVMIHVLETDTIEPLSKELLEQYTFTKDELLKNTNMYNELIDRYPDDVAFIKGCMYPVDIETAINAPDGTILSYNPNFIEESEYSLLDELEDYIKNFLVRWNVRAYNITDELYLPSLIAVLYASLPNKINNIRLSKINTAEVHSFHMEQYFRSTMDIWNDIDVLRPETKYWLYKNIKFLLKHVGKEETFKIILNKVFDANSVGVGEFVLKTPVSDNLYEDDYSLPNFNPTEVIAITKALNSSYILDKNSVNTLEHVVELELTTLDDIESSLTISKHKYIASNIKKDLNIIQYEDLKTKVLDLNLNKLFKLHGVDLYKLLIDHWVIAVKHEKYKTVVDYSNPTGTEDNTVVNELINYTEPNTSQVYTITTRTGLLMLLKLFMVLTDTVDNPINKLITSTVLTNDTNDLDTVLSKIYRDGYIENMYPVLKEHLPIMPDGIKKPEAFGDYLLKVIHYYKYLWVMDANCENNLLSSNIKQVLNKLTTYETYDLTVNGTALTIDELLRLEGVQYTINNSFDIIKSINSLIKTFTNIEVDEYLAIKERLRKFKNIMHKLTSYTMQVVTNTDDTNPIYLRYNNIGNIRSKNGLIAVLESDLTPLEQEYTKIEAIANDYREYLSGRSDPSEPYSVMCTKSITGYGEIIDVDKDIVYVVEPTFVAEIYNDFRCDLRYVIEEDVFILGINAVLDPLENIPIATSNLATTGTDTLIARDAMYNPYTDDNVLSINGIVTADVTQEEDLLVEIPSPEMNIEII